MTAVVRLRCAFAPPRPAYAQLVYRAPARADDGLTAMERAAAGSADRGWLAEQLTGLEFAVLAVVFGERAPTHLDVLAAALAAVMPGRMPVAFLRDHCLAGWIVPLPADNTLAVWVAECGLAYATAARWRALVHARLDAWYSEALTRAEWCLSLREDVR